MLEAMIPLIAHGWGRDNSAFRQLFTNLFMPSATEEQAKWFNELQRKTVTPEVASQLWTAIAEFNVEPLLAEVAVPTLVIHASDDALVPIKLGQDMASGIKDARFVTCLLYTSPSPRDS